MPYHDDELANAGEKKVDLENLVAADFSKLETVVSQFSVLNGEIAELREGLGPQSAQQLNTDVRRDGELRIFTTGREDLDLDENPIVENTHVTELSKHEHDVARGKRQRGKQQASTSAGRERGGERKGKRKGEGMRGMKGEVKM